MVIFLRPKTRYISGTCVDNSDCPKNFVCLENPENNNEKECLPTNKFFCQTYPFTSLTQCECKLDENGDCIDAKNECQICANNPAFSCVRVTNSKPYSWTQDGKKVNVPISNPGQTKDGKYYGWCLPNIDTTTQTCNPFTSEYILTGDPNTGKYEWGCYCKYQNLFDHVQGPTSDCTFVRACGMPNEELGQKFGTLMVPTEMKCKKNEDCKENDICLNLQTPPPCGNNNESCEKSDNCVCHTEWKGVVAQNTNPLTGQCVCNNEKNLKYQCLQRSQDSYEMNCVQGFCNGFSVDESKNCNVSQCYLNQDNCVCCKCPPGYIRCPDDINSNNELAILFCKQNGPQCILDPCKTDSVPNGYYDPKKRHCVCPGENNIVAPDENSPVGQICVNACDPNPCGNRGTCYLPENAQGPDDALCCDCVAPYTNEGDNNCRCSKTQLDQYGHVKRRIGYPCNDGFQCSSGKCHTFVIENKLEGRCVGTDPITSPCGESKCNVILPPVSCSSSKSCPHDNTCCNDGNDGFNCCPYPNATCCEDNIHCCPINYPVCDVKSQTCKTADGKKFIPWKEKV